MHQPGFGDLGAGEVEGSAGAIMRDCVACAGDSRGRLGSYPERARSSGLTSLLLWNRLLAMAAPIRQTAGHVVSPGRIECPLQSGLSAIVREHLTY
jgi:hypothetical protein